MTVIELVVVVALIGIMAGVVAPSVVSLDRSGTTRTVADRVDALVRFGRAGAIERARRVELTIDPETGRFWFDVSDSAGIIVLPEGSALVAGAKRVHLRFEPNGEASVDEVLSVRQGEATIGVIVGR